MPATIAGGGTSLVFLADGIEVRLIAPMHRDEEAGPAEDGHLSRELLHRAALRRTTLVVRAHDHERGVGDFFVLGKMVGLEAVLDQCGKQAVLVGHLAQLIPARIDQIDPDEPRLGDVEDEAAGHATRASGSR